MLRRNVWANLGTHSPSGQHFVAPQREGLLADRGLCPPHASPSLTSSSSQHLVHAHTWFVMACGLQWAPERWPVQQEDLAPNPQTQPTSQEVDSSLQSPRPSPLSLPSFLFLPPAWPHKAGLDCTAYAHTKSFSLSPFIYQMEPYHMVLIGCN